MIRTDKTDRLLESIAETLESIDQRQTDQWRLDRKWSTILGIFSLVLVSINVFVAMIGIYFHPDETKALWETIKSFLG